MRRKTVLTRRAAVLGSVLLVVLARRGGAQSGSPAGWNDARTRALVEMATRRRAEQLADTGLVDYRANARGYVTFLAQVGDGFLETPKLVKTDQLALEVYWRAPNLSKQRIVGRRDTTLLPTDIQYHRDHLGIVQNNFPDFIRIGEGDEVRDVPHPLSAAGLRLYDFAISDSIRMGTGGQDIDLIEVKVRPKEDRDARVIGAIYLEPVGAHVVRMAFNFTRAAFLDDHLEDLAVMLENRLISGRYWLPSRQTIEIRRTGTYLDFPVKGIIRGMWDVGEYQFNLALPQQMFVGAEIVSQPAAELKAFQWPTPTIMEALPPDVQATADPDIKRIQDEARVLVRARALERVEPFRLSARRASDFIRFNRVEGLSFGPGGFSLRAGSRIFLGGRVRMGMDDHHQIKGMATVRWEQPSGTRFELFGGRDLHDIGDQPERSLLFNSIASQEFASDLTDPYNLQEIGARFVKRFGATDLSIRAAQEQHKRLAVHGLPVTGVYEPTPEISPLLGVRGELGLLRALTPWWGPGRLRFDARASALGTSEPEAFSGLVRSGLMSYRASLDAEQRSELGRATLVLRGTGAAMFGDTTLLQEAVYFGGPSSLPGYALHEVAGKYGASGRVEMQLPVPFVPIPLGRFGRIPSQAKLAPYVGGAWVSGALPCAIVDGRCPVLLNGFYPTAGIGVLTVFDLLRFDVARGLKNGRWIFNVDVNREFWSIL